MPQEKDGERIKWGHGMIEIGPNLAQLIALIVAAIAICRVVSLILEDERNKKQERESLLRTDGSKTSANNQPKWKVGG